MYAIALYTKPGCPQCVATKRRLDRNGAQYTTIDVTQDPDAISYLADLGHRSLPVVVLDTGAHWSGFKPDLIDAATKETR